MRLPEALGLLGLVGFVVTAFEGCRRGDSVGRLIHERERGRVDEGDEAWGLLAEGDGLSRLHEALEDRGHPALWELAGEAGDDEVVAGAGEGYIEEAAFLGVRWSFSALASSQPSGSKLPILSQPRPSAWRTMDFGVRELVGEEVADDDDRVLEALGVVDGDDLDLGAGLVADRGVAFLARRPRSPLGGSGPRRAGWRGRRPRRRGRRRASSRGWRRAGRPRGGAGRRRGRGSCRRAGR